MGYGAIGAGCARGRLLRKFKWRFDVEPVDAVECFEKGIVEGRFRLPRPTQVYRHCVPSNRGFTIDSCVRKDFPHEAFCKETANPNSVPRPLWLEDDCKKIYLSFFLKDDILSIGRYMDPLYKVLLF